MELLFVNESLPHERIRSVAGGEQINFNLKSGENFTVNVQYGNSISKKVESDIQVEMYFPKKEEKEEGK